MQSATLRSVHFEVIPAMNQVAMVKHRLTDDPDVDNSYTTDSTSVIIHTDGVLATPLVINNLNENTSYTLWITMDCTSFKKAFTTAAPSCGIITDMTVTLS